MTVIATDDYPDEICGPWVSETKQVYNIHINNIHDQTTDHILLQPSQNKGTTSENISHQSYRPTENEL